MKYLKQHFLIKLFLFSICAYVTQYYVVHEELIIARYEEASKIMKMGVTLAILPLLLKSKTFVTQF